MAKFSYGSVSLIAVMLQLCCPLTAYCGDEAKENGYEVLKSGRLRLCVDPKSGGRIASFQFDGKEILRTERDPNGWHWGSTVWISPQSDWKWPPPATFDAQPFEVELSDGKEIRVSSEVDQATKLKLTKQIRFQQFKGDADPVAVITYTLSNEGTDERVVGIWENTRVRWKGFTEFPAGGTIRLSAEERSIKTESRGQRVRLVFDQKQPNGQKVFVTPAKGSGETWNSYHYNGMVFTKSRKTPTAVPEGQAALEIYLAPNDGFAELENQSDVFRLAAGESASMTVRWSLKSE